MSAGAAIGHTDFRPDIQALRAIAVALVLGYHVWPPALEGGFVGVDVFFVISGYLITDLLMREVQQGGLSFRRFYARRIRRLLPAASLVLVATLLVGAMVLPSASLPRLGWEGIASALYVQNWMLVAQSVDYMSMDAAPSPLMHYWSLSIEEQFYFFWPVTLALAAAAARRSGFSVRLACGYALGAIFLVSLAWGIYVSFIDPAAGYFSTATRVWQLSAGGIVAIAEIPRLSRRSSLLLGGAGLAVVVATAIVYDSTLPFPGYEALGPVIGASAIIVARVPQSSFLGEMATRGSVQYLGGISYSLYLWHWPVVVFYPAFAGHPIEDLADAVLVVLISVGLAHLTKRHVEDRFRYTRSAEGASVRAVRTAPLVFGSATLPVAGIALALIFMGRADVPEAEGLADDDYPGALVQNSAALRPMPIAPDPATAQLDKGTAYGEDGRSERCIARQQQTEILVCEYGADSASKHVALVGDSHAVHWLPAFEEASAREGWRFSGITKDSCAFTDVMVQYGRRGAPGRDYIECKLWMEQVLVWLSDARPDVLVISYSPRHRVEGAAYLDAQEGVGAGTARLARAVRQMGIQVVAIRHTPWNVKDIPSCVSANESDWQKCATSTSEAFWPAALDYAAGADTQLHLLDFRDVFCEGGVCNPVIGNVLVYRDSHHLTATFSRTLWKALAMRLDELPEG